MSECKDDEVDQVISVCLVIACKYEEIYSDNFTLVHVERLLDVHVHHLVTLERKILMKLDYRLGFVIASSYLANLGDKAKTSKTVLSIALFLLCSSTLDPNSCLHFPSELACASLMVAEKIHNRRDWDWKEYQLTGYNSLDLEMAKKLVIRWKSRKSILYRMMLRNQLKYD